MGKLNEIQSQKTQSYGDNAFTTTITDDTVEFDSLKDKFTFKDEVEVPSLKVNGESITPSAPQQQSDWNQEDTEAADYIKNKPTIPTPIDPIFVKNGEGINSVLIGNIDRNKATGKYSVAEGHGTKAYGENSHAEGEGTTASGMDSHSEGAGTTASEFASHVEGAYGTASGMFSHAEGNGTKASGLASHAEGGETTAGGENSHAEGMWTTAGRKNQHVFGKFNEVETGDGKSEGTYVEIVGNGTDNDERSNARTLDWSGNEVLSGTLTATGVSTGELTINGESVVLGGVQFKIDGSPEVSPTLLVSLDGGATWKTVTLT